MKSLKNFNPRPPRGGRHYPVSFWLTPDYFNPHPPRGGRLISGNATEEEYIFQSTPSVRRTTRSQGNKLHGGLISIHALREEDDPGNGGMPFNVRISIHALREENDKGYFRKFSANWHFNPHPPRGGRLSSANLKLYQSGNFNPRPP